MEKKNIDGKSLAQLARALTHEALETVKHVMRDPDTPKHLRLHAAEVILRRGWGDVPKTAPDLAGGVKVYVQQLTADLGPIPGVLASPVAGNVWRPGAVIEALPNDTNQPGRTPEIPVERKEDQATARVSDGS